MNFDISHLLEQWDYQPGQVVVRKFTGKDGQEKIQLRIDLGLLQMNAQGRPDGKRPFGHPTLFDFFLARQGKDLPEGDVASVEGYFSIFKRGLVGTFHHVAPKHLQRYSNEFSFRYNNRVALGVNDADRAAITLKAIAGKRLTYRRIGGNELPNA